MPATLVTVHPSHSLPSRTPAMSLAYVSFSLVSLSFYFTDFNAFILVTFHILSFPSFLSVLSLAHSR
ncbi:hypothetical protein EV702DRAFT_1125017 [Suillus placidus]|uniref:Uncharacterized protein n=1 Tax=Suillus placidus TaxID=48579 RepID=A0A9P6ZPG7_9AGAM|nr:hypothetical protein EV702DRAFT_1125017 [Suillus placidus]